MSDAEFSNRLFSVVEAADHLRISRAMVYKLINGGSLRPVHIGTRVVITGKELSRFVEAAQAA